MYKIVCIIALVVQLVAAQPTIICEKPNELFMECGPRCPQKCDVRPSECKAVNVCTPGCYCKAGYVLNNGTCRDEKIVCCPKNEIFACGSACQNECATLGEVCPIQTLVCVENCFCVDGYARNKNGKCIPESKCPPKNGTTCTKTNEHYEECASSFEPSCANRTPNRCGGSECIAKCVCDDGYVRDRNKNCVKTTECGDANKNCKRNQSYQSCGNPCQGTCANPDLPLVCRAPCRPGCFCNDGFLFKEQNKMCVKPSDC